MSKIAEIKERAEKARLGSVSRYPRTKEVNKLLDQDIPNLCDALDFAKGKLIAHGYPFSASKIDQILEKGKNAKG